MVLPWSGKVEVDACQGIRVNHGLYTQCKGVKEGSRSYCVTCGRNGGPKYGDISERSSDEFAHASKVVRYSKVMEKLGISREEAELAASAAGVTIAESEFEKMTVGRRGRPRKVMDASSSDSDSPPKKRGRPKKQKTVVARSAGEDLIASLMATAAEDTGSSSDSVAVQSVEVAKAEKQAAAKTEKAEKQAAAKTEKLAEKAEKQLRQRRQRSLRRRQRSRLQRRQRSLRRRQRSRQQRRQRSLRQRRQRRQRSLRLALKAEKQAAAKAEKLDAKAEEGVRMQRSLSDQKAKKLAAKEAKKLAVKAEKLAAKEAKKLAVKDGKLVERVAAVVGHLNELEAAKEAEKQAQLGADAEKLIAEKNGDYAAAFYALQQQEAAKKLAGESEVAANQQETVCIPRPTLVAPPSLLMKESAKEALTSTEWAAKLADMESVEESDDEIAEALALPPTLPSLLMKNSPENSVMESVEEEEESDDEDGTEVEEFSWEGKDYIMDPSSGTLYNKTVFEETGEPEEVGTFNSDTQTVTFV